MPTFNMFMKNINQIKAHNLFDITNISLFFRREIACEKKEYICNFK